MANLNTFMLEIRLALALNPVQNPDATIKHAAKAMRSQGRFKRTSAERHVNGAIVSASPWAVMKNAIRIHQEQTQ